MKIIKIDRYRLAYLLDGPQMIYDEDGDWVLHETSSSHIADLEAQLAAAQKRNQILQSLIGEKVPTVPFKTSTRPPEAADEPHEAQIPE